MGPIVLLWVVLAALHAACPASALPPCTPQFVEGQAVFVQSCTWQKAVAPISSRLLLEGKQSIGRLPFLNIQTDPAAPLAPAPTGYHSLTIKRLSLDHVTVALPGKASVPLLLPLGLFSAVPSNLTLMDARLVVTQHAFAAYLEFFSKQLDAVKLTIDKGSISLQTDGKSFLHIPSWSNGNTQLYAVTLVTGPCKVSYGVGRVAADWNPLPGCNLLATNNATLVQVLLRNASIATAEPLLIRITTNMTLGPGINGSLPIRRPVILLGLASSVTSVDLGMVVNQLNVTGPTGTLVWQGLVLENLAPGDTLSSVIAPPYSTTTSTNMWAIYCNRSAALCVRMNNVTMVIPTEREVNYHLFMYTMFNSPAPSLKQLAGFMQTDLGFKQLEFVAGPGNDTMTIKRLLSRSWQFKNVVTTARTFVALQLPVPPRPFVLTRTGPAPLVQAIQDCNSFRAAVDYNTTGRMFVWRLLKNVSIGENGERTCSFPSGYIASPTHLFGQVLADHQQQTATVASSVGLAAATGFEAGTPSAAAAPALAPPGPEVYSLSFGYVPSFFDLPPDAQDKYVHIQNVTLAQLPQQPAADDSTGGRAGWLLRQVSGSGAAAPPGVWTILLWAFRRSSSGSLLYVADTQLMLPGPEWDLLAQVARGDDSFAMQLQGPAGLTFTSVTLLESWPAIRVGSLQGPGVSGSNLWLLRDPTPVSDIPGYSWPASLTAAAVRSDGSFAVPQTDQHRLSAGVQAAIGISIGVVGLLAVVLAALFLQQRRCQHRAKDSSVDTDLLPKSRAPSVGPCMHDGHGTASSHSSKSTCGKSAGLLPPSPTDTSLVFDACSTHGSMSIRLAAAQPAAAGIAANQVLQDKLATGCAERLSNRGSSSAARASGRAAGSQSERSGASMSVEQSIAQGLERWSAAVSATTMQLMKRRLQVNSHTARFRSSSNSSSSQLPAAYGTDEPGSPVVNRKGSGGSDMLQLGQVIGIGSFGSVYLGTWRGKQVAVKVMHLPADALTDSAESAQGSQQAREERDSSSNAGDHYAAAGDDVRSTSQQDAQKQQQHGQQGNLQRRQLQRQRQQNSPPHMAIMEAVVSSTMCHPNVIQVFTYMLTPLMAHDAVRQQQQQQHGGGQQQCCQPYAGKALADADKGLMSGWQLRLVMEYADQGTLREALDRKQLPHLPGTTFLQPVVVQSLCHDIAAALLHLHSEGIVHGDLKTANVLLTTGHLNSSSSEQRCCCGTSLDSSPEVWAAAGSLPLTAKVADFGLALPLGPTDTHATMLARGTPTHMSPEIFMSGRVSKASDVYAFGILLFEIITGRRAYAGVPVALLPHEVAVKGLRPQWPLGVPTNCLELQQLAEACWAREPEDRPSFVDILAALEQCCVHRPRAAAAQPPPSAGTGTLAGAAGPAVVNCPGCAASTAHVDPQPPVDLQPAQQQAQQQELAGAQTVSAQQQQHRQQVRVHLRQGAHHDVWPPQQHNWLSPGLPTNAHQQEPPAAAVQPLNRQGVHGLNTEPNNRKPGMLWSEVSYGASDS